MKPDVVSRDLHPHSGEESRFLILASDGCKCFSEALGQPLIKQLIVWDRLSSEEAALLMSAHLAHPTHPDIPKVTPLRTISRKLNSVISATRLFVCTPSKPSLSIRVGS